MSRRIPKPLKNVLKSEGRVSLMTLTRPDTDVRIYAVSYPHKAGGVTLKTNITSQFLKRAEAESEYRRFADYFNEKGDRA